MNRQPRIIVCFHGYCSHIWSVSEGKSGGISKSCKTHTHSVSDADMCYWCFRMVTVEQNISSWIQTEGCLHCSEVTVVTWERDEKECQKNDTVARHEVNTYYLSVHLAVLFYHCALLKPNDEPTFTVGIVCFYIHWTIYHYVIYIQYILNIV